MKKKYDIVYSIGRDCWCASYLWECGVRLTSGPFDWLTKASFEDRFILMLNDFKYFLDKKYLKLMPKPTNRPVDENNDYYENIKTHLYFWHDFSCDKSFDEAYPLVKEKYERRIKRFYRNIKNKKNVLLVWFSQVDQTPDDVVLDLCKRFCLKMNKKIDFLIIEHKEGLNEARSYILADNIKRWHCHARKNDENGKPVSNGNKELVFPIFSTIQLKKSMIQNNYLLRLLGKVKYLFFKGNKK